MSTLAVAYLNLKLDASVSEVEAVKEYLAVIGEIYATQLYEQDTDVYVRIEAGSLKTWVAVTGAIYTGVAAYGSFRSGIDHLNHDALAFGSAITSKFIETANIEDEKIYRVERRLGMPGRIKRLFSKIDNLETDDRVSKSEITDLCNDPVNNCTWYSRRDCGGHHHDARTRNQTMDCEAQG